MLPARAGLPAQGARERKQARQALEDCGVQPVLKASGGGSDVNALLVNGFPSVNLCNAMVDVHTPGERIRSADIDLMVEVTQAIVARALA